MQHEKEKEKSSNSKNPIIIATAVCAAAAAAIAGFFIGRYAATTDTQEGEKTRDFQVSDPTCSICREDIYVSMEKYLKCGHVFHKSCIEEWLKQNNSCPNCNKKV